MISHSIMILVLLTFGADPALESHEDMSSQQNTSAKKPDSVEDKEKQNANLIPDSTINWGEQIWRWGWIVGGSTVSVSGAGITAVTMSESEPEFTWMSLIGPTFMFTGILLSVVGVILNPLEESTDQ